MKLFKKKSKECDNYTDVIYKEASALASQGEKEKAIEKFSELAKRNPANGVAWYNMGRLYQAMSNNDKAISAYQRSLWVYKKNFDALYNLGICYYNKGDHHDAHNQMGRAKMSLKAAIENFRKALEIQPDNTDVWFKLGNTYLRNRDYKKAIETYNHIIRLEPTFMFASVRYNLGSAHHMLARKKRRTTDLGEAIVHYKEALDKDPNNTDLLHDLGQAVGQNGDMKQARIYLERSIELDKKNITSWCDLGLVCSQLGDYDKAVTCWKTVLEIEPSDKTAQQSLEWLKSLIYEKTKNSTHNQCNKRV